ncbi:MAG: phosphatase PAP2 family protein [Spirochaetales bacterium]|nr:phosphatase PAP2 family protein [Spirochaetales bacterium]
MGLKKIACLLIYLTAICFAAFADSEYSLDPVIDSIIGVSALGVYIPSVLIDGEPGTPMPSDEINPLDSLLIFPYGKAMDDISTVGVFAALLLPVVSVIDHIGNVNDLLTYGVMYAEAFLLTAGTKDLLKAAVTRYRPYTYAGPIPSGEEDDYFNSFPSGHTAYAFLGASFLLSTLSVDYPDAKWRIPLVTAGYTLAVTISGLRILSGNHFITDAVAGAAIGSLYGLLIPRLHRRAIDDSAEVSFVLGPRCFTVEVRL